MIRPEARALLTRWAEPALVAGLTLIGARMGWRAVERGGLLGWPALLVVLAGGLLWLRAAVMRARLGGAGEGGSIRVHAEEERLLVLAPMGNHQLALDDIMQVAVTDGGAWLLAQREGPPVIVPRAAEGAADLADALAALPGFSAGRAADAFARPGGRLVTIWRRDAKPLAPHLTAP